jgi:hypothetical protein
VVVNFQVLLGKVSDADKTQEANFEKLVSGVHSHEDV